MSHPCGDYNSDTLSILKDLGIQIGFRSSLEPNEIKSKYEIPRGSCEYTQSNEIMKITLFSSNQPRHLNLAKLLGEFADQVYFVSEVNTVFPGKLKIFIINQM